jgi:hypothetical protein
MSTLSYILAYQMCVYRDGEQCQRCGRKIGDLTTYAERRHGAPDKILKLQLDHIDGNSANNNPENFRLLCRTCNLEMEAELRLGGVEEMRERGRERGRESEGASPAVDASTKVQEGANGTVRRRKQAKVQEERKAAAKRERNRKREEGNESTRAVRQMVDFRTGEATMQANAAYEVKFRNWVLGEVGQRGFIGKRKAVDSGAEYVGCSVLTAEKYLRKLTSMEGPLQTITDAAGEVQLTWKNYLLEENP